MLDLHDIDEHNAIDDVVSLLAGGGPVRLPLTGAQVRVQQA
jgi:hypothetical protein